MKHLDLYLQRRAEYRQNFEHDYSDTKTSHTFKGSLLRHVTVERVIYKMKDWYMDHDALPMSSLLSFLISFLFGLNCNFPIRDVVRYVTEELRTEMRIRERRLKK